MKTFPFLSLHRCRTALFLLCLTASLSCRTNDQTTALPKTIPDRILEDDQFRVFRAAMTYAGLGDALKSANLTLFAPTDSAFQASGLNTGSFASLPKDQVRTLLLYHVLYASVPAAGLPSGLNSVETASSGIAFVNKTGGGSIYINNAQVIQPDLTTANGVIHVIDHVLTPSVGNVLTTIQNNPKLTYLTAALRRVGSTNPTLQTLLTNTSPSNTITIFAPNDDAFRAAGYETLAAIETANVQTLANTLLYHMASGVVFTDQLQTGTIGTLYNNTKLRMTVKINEITIRGNKNTTVAVIRTPDLAATNGVVHIIDQVLLP